ncbi:low temperature requirement protein A [Micromonospora sp. WMMD712]|uniref:low temperature requirement protein A n=1 Tax=Micromonospora sp. WMMD712 TaxID=3016096 RepID=UPI00249A6E58|nr:low temperature requirement protein A [Micromonospora sp. WMMD712]WFE60668.1 low temperature requirement protein A [Micromonospora sp. WMMD712]
MTEDQRGAALLRGAVSSPRASFLELFFDLVFVFALTRVSQRIIDEVTSPGRDVWSEVAQTVLLFLALWLVWTLTAWVTSRYEPERGIIQFVVVATMFGSMVMAVALPRAFAERALPFVCAYLAIQIGRPLLVTVALRRHPRRRVTTRIMAWFAAGAVPWLAGALVPQPALRAVCWTAALAWDYAGLALGWPVPRLGPTRVSGWAVMGEHLAERYQQIFLIALGETILVIGFTFSNSGFAATGFAAFALSFLVTALFWRIYFHRAGHLLTEAIRVARSPGLLGESASWTHLVIVAGVLVTGVGYELVIDHPYARMEPVWPVFVMGGPALFLAARARFEYEIFGRVSRSRLAGVLALVALAPVALRMSPVVALASAAAVLAAIAVRDMARSWGRPVERPASPLDRPGPAHPQVAEG